MNRTAQEELMLDIQSEYRRKRFIFVPGADMIAMLGLFHNRVQEDLSRLADVGHALPSDPTLPFRRSRNGRFLYDMGDNTFTRLEFQPFILTAGEDFVREDSGQFRHFRAIQDDLQLNCVFKALMAFKALVAFPISTQERKELDYHSNEFISTVFHLRTITNPTLLGEPAREGVHSDGVDHTMTTLLHHQNMRRDSAVSAVHTNAQVTGVAWNEIDPKHQVGQAQHLNLLDTLLIADNERKHSVSPVFPIIESSNALRDMLIVFSRKPALPNHPSANVDSKTPHPDLPCSFDAHTQRATGKLSRQETDANV